MIKNAQAMAAAVLTAAAVTGGVAASASAAEGSVVRDVPFDPGYGTTWYSYEIAPLSSRSDAAVRSLGRFEGDRVLCTWNKGGLQQCYVEGKHVVDFGATPWGRVISTDPLVVALEQILSRILSLRNLVAP